ncbi:MAG TPA: glycosyltransferase [Bryobacteraceae bacterium]|jgi:phosphatidylinositol alpha-1,6-mannosyltransferase|nr:glycosyltransferase [Bryobacteraceae bacterium]
MNLSPRRVDLLALFPAFESAYFGGVQAAGRQAWHGITARPRPAEAFFYETGAPKLPAVLRAIASRVSPETVLVWHCGLLKLRPFIASSTGRRVLFLHGIEAWRKHDPLTSLLMRKTDLFLSNSDHTWKRFLEFHPELEAASHRTVHLGTGEPSLLPFQPPSETPAALMIGRMQRGEGYKGHREMIQAWPLVTRSMPAAELWIAGGGDLRPELEQLAGSLGISNNVKFYGAVPDAVKEELIRNCRVLALPSTGEGFGLVYLEAMRLGRPCIVSKLDAGSEVVNPPEAGASVDLADSAQIAASVLALLSGGPDWDQISARARQRYEARFTAAHFERRLSLALFNE